MSLKEKLLESLEKKFGDPAGDAFGRLCVFGVLAYTTFQHPPINEEKATKFNDALLVNFKRFSAWCGGQTVEEKYPTKKPQPQPQPQPQLELPTRETQRFEITLPDRNKVVVIRVDPGHISDREIYYSFDLLRKLHLVDVGEEITVSRLYDNGNRLQITPDVPEQRN